MKVLATGFQTGETLVSGEVCGVLAAHVEGDATEKALMLRERGCSQMSVGATFLFVQGRRSI